MEMKRNPLAGVGKVYRFSLKQMCAAKSWIISTVIIALLLLCGIPLLLWATTSSADKEPEENDGKAHIKTVLVCDETEGKADYSALKSVGYEKLDYQTFDTMDAAVAGIQDADSTVILRVTKPDEAFLLTAYLPDQTELSRSTARSFLNFVEANFKSLLMQKANLQESQIAALSVPVSTATEELTVQTDDSDSQDEENGIVEVLVDFAVPFLTLFLMYMMVILYGQAMSNSVMSEKNSKLIETILTAVHPFALMFGKLLATATAAVLQLMIWLGCLIGGAFGGVFFVKQVIENPDSQTVAAVDAVIANKSIFSLSGILLAILLIALGFLLYLSLGAISGAMASKSEDLSKTQIVFTLVLVISFFLCLGSPNDADEPQGMVSQARWLRFFPFTSVLVMPSKLLVGKAGAADTAICFACMIAGVVLLVALAAAIYKMLVLYRGTPPTPKKLLEMAKQNRPAK